MIGNEAGSTELALISYPTSEGGKKPRYVVLPVTPPAHIVV